MIPMGGFSRREFLKLLAGGSALGASALFSKRIKAFGGINKFLPQILDFPGSNWQTRADGIKRLQWEVMRRTSVEASLTYRSVSPDSDELFRSPFLYIYGDESFPEWSEEWRLKLNRFLTYGGFLLIDSDGSKKAGFDESIRREIGKIFPDRKINKLPESHTVYKSFYLIREQAGRVIEKAYMEGVDIDDRSVIIYTQNDLAGAWARDEFGSWLYDVVPGGERQREMAFRMGINIVMYALCVNYKSDQVHIPFILKRRR